MDDTLAVNKQDGEPDGLRARFNTDLENAKKFMDPIHQKMDQFYEIYRNRWSEKTYDFQVSDLYAYVETVVPILTNNRVRGSVHSDYPEYIRHAEGLGDILDHTYDVNNWDYESQEIARMAEIYRSAISYTGYDTDAKNGTGQLCIKGINIRWCYLDPAPTKFEESSFFFYVEPKRKSEVFKRYPAKKKDIEESIDRRSGSMSTESGRGNNWFKSWVKTVANALVSFGDRMMQRIGDIQTLPELDEDQKRKDAVAFIHYWYRDEDTDEWRSSYWCDEVFLEDTENPFWHGELPYDIYNPTKDILSSMGIPMGEHIENLNWERNVLMQLITKSAKKAVDPPIVLSTMANLKDPEVLYRKDREIIHVNNPDNVPLEALYSQLHQEQLPAWVDNLPEKLNQMEDRITGVNDSFRGMSDATSGKEVQLKQEAAYTRIKTKVDNFELFNKKQAGKIIINAMQFYDKTRAFRVKGDYTKYQDLINQSGQSGQAGQPAQSADGASAPFEVKPIQKGMNPDTQEPVYDRSEFFMYANPNEWTKLESEPDAEEEEAAEEDGQQGQQQASGDPQQQQPAGGDQQEPGDQQDQGEQEEPGGEQQEEADEEKPATKENVKQAYRILQMTVEIEAGSSLPVSRLARREEALELFDKQAIDQEALLDAYDWKDRDKVIKRMEEKAQAAQQAQQQQVQMELEAKKPVPRSPAESISFKDLPPEGQVQLAAQAGIQLKPENIVAHQARTAALSNPPQQPGGAPSDQGSAQQPQQPDIASGLDAIRQAVPELAQASDEELLKIMAKLPKAG